MDSGLIHILITVLIFSCFCVLLFMMLYSGRPPHLSIEEEAALAGQIKSAAAFGRPLTIQYVRLFVQLYVKRRRAHYRELGQHDKAKGVIGFPAQDDYPSMTWYYGFMKRNTEIVLKRPRKLCSSKTKVSAQEVQLFGENLIHMLQALPPENVVNADETCLRNGFEMECVSTLPCCCTLLYCIVTVF